MYKKIYVDWLNEVIVTDPDEYINNYVADNVDDDDRFSEWLNDEYSAYDLWKMDGKECEDITEEWKAYLRNEADEEFDYFFDEVDLYFPDKE